MISNLLLVSLSMNLCENKTRGASHKTAKDKIVETANIPVTIPGFGEKYTLDENLKVESNYNQPGKERYLRLEVLDRMETLQEEIEDMKNIIKEDMLSKERNDEDVQKINEKIKEIERKIVDIIENS